MVLKCAGVPPPRWTVASVTIPGRVFFVRAIELIDGRNLFHLEQRVWASDPDSPYAWPSYDVEELASLLVSRMPGRTLT